MKFNKNDYVIVNGKKYYAEGGSINAENNINNINRKWTVFPTQVATWNIKEKRGTNKKTEMSPEHGHQKYEKLNDLQKNDFLTGRDDIATFFKEIRPDLIDDYKINIDDFVNDTNNARNKTGKVNFENDNNKNAYRALQSLGYGFENDGDKGYLGDNMVQRIGTFRLRMANQMPYAHRREIDKIKDLLMSEGKEDLANNIDNLVEERFTRGYDPNTGESYITIPTSIVSGRKGNSYGSSMTVGFDKNGNMLKWSKPHYINRNGMNVIIGESPEILDDQDQDGVYYFENLLDQSGLFKDFGNQKERYYTFPKNPNWQSNAYGGRTSRLYADGGSMGQIPIGEQEDYNMVDAGGSHEQNPMGGVPYGMNQDGSQNMVEEGEVSVGDNVFSDRSSLSPELCQQLGMPEGTSPAQAMQQIEQLYEQGQISDEEYQEIQNIIFEDQEMQKQNVGGSYQQGQVGGEGTEGLDPSMLGMQEPMGQPQMQAPTEGIDPSQLGVPMAFGGRRRYYCR